MDNPNRYVVKMEEFRPSVRALSVHIFKKLMKGRDEKIHEYLCDIGLTGAKIAGMASSGNALLKLNRNYPLGARGTVIELAEDSVIFRQVRLRGRWEPEISEFLKEGLDATGNIESRAALLDIGANAGLISIQTMLMARHAHEYFLFEPLPQHVAAIKQNVAARSSIFHVVPKALSKSAGFATIHTEKRNYGNSSVHKSALSNPRLKMSTQIETVDTQNFFMDFGTEFGRFVIKSDTQGMDALILSRIPEHIWKKTVRAVVEIWALPEVDEQDVRRLLAMWREFGTMSWHRELSPRVELSEIEEFWISKSGRQQNLFLKRNSK